MFETFAISNVSYPLYIAMIVILNITYILLALGILCKTPEYLHTLSLALHVFVCMFLIIRFHPFTKSVMSPYDKDIIFGSAIILLENVIFYELGIDSNKIGKMLHDLLNQ